MDKSLRDGAEPNKIISNCSDAIGAGEAVFVTTSLFILSTQ